MARIQPLPIRDWDAVARDPAPTVASLLRAGALLVADLEVRFADAGLPTFDVARLLWLWSDHGHALGLPAIARRLGLSRPATSRLVGRAVRVGLVERVPDLLDRREISVRVTTRGRASIHWLDAALRSCVTAAGGLDETELGVLATVVERMVRRYERGT